MRFELPKEAWLCLSPYEQEFVHLETTGRKTFDYYTARLKMLGFEGRTAVLDAACGIGQWSIALGCLNTSVMGVDIDTGRLLTARELVRGSGVSNITFRNARLECVPYDDEAFDLVFCYGSIMFSHIHKTLSEFYRVLRPGGQLYLNGNAFGWYLHLIIDRGVKKKTLKPIISALWMIGRTCVGLKSNIVISRKWLESMTRQHGFHVVAAGAEGTINVTGAASVPPAYPGKCYGLCGVVEVLAEKVRNQGKD